MGVEADPSKQTNGIHFWGHSFISGQQGELLACAEHQQEGLVSAEINLDRTEQVRRIWPYFRDRRVDAYQGLDKRYLDDK